MEELDYDLLFRWFVGLSMDDPVWDHSVFSKNRDRLLGGEFGNELFGTQGMENFNQVGFPRTISGFTPTWLGGNMGANAAAIYKGTTVATFVSAGGTYVVH